MDFTIKTYKNLLKSLQNAGFSFVTFEEYIKGVNYDKFVILRHDVDLLPENSFEFARIQKQLGIKGSYYFRAVPESWNEIIIKEISRMGHEVGYHYENMDVAFQKFVNSKQVSREDVEVIIKEIEEMRSERREMSEGGHTSHLSPLTSHLLDVAYEDFCQNLEKLRELVPVSTICMHGSPMSKFDNKAIWDKYDYKELGITGEPYYNVDFDKLFYLTDTGRRWDGYKVSVRDKVPQQDEWMKQGLTFYSTKDIVIAAENNNLPNKTMITTHPQRWTDNKIWWTKELVLQNLKNIIKRYFYVKP